MIFFLITFVLIIWLMLKLFFKTDYKPPKHKNWDNNYNISYENQYIYNKPDEIIRIINEKDINIKNEEYQYYIGKEYIMTSTELLFYRQLKTITNSLNMTIFTQVDLERIIRVKNNIPRYRNRIKSRSIDFVIVRNSNCKIVCAIELDDYTHNYQSRTERDNFINGLFKAVNIPLLRIKVTNNYDIENIKNEISKCVI